MGDLLIRNIPDDLRNALKAQASEHNRSLSHEACVLLQSAIMMSQHNLLKPKATAFDVFREFGNAMRTNEQDEAEWAKIVQNARNVQDRDVADFE